MGDLIRQTEFPHVPSCTLEGNLRLPFELFTTIAEFLARNLKLGTTANLNVSGLFACKATNAVLWTTVTLDTHIPKCNNILAKAAFEVEESPADQGSDSMNAIVETSERCKDQCGYLPADRRYVR